MLGRRTVVGGLFLIFSFLPECPEEMRQPGKTSPPPIFDSFPRVQISVDEPEVAPLVTKPEETLKIGDSGEKVRALQQFLTDVQLYNGRITGIYDEATAEAVKSFQKIFGLRPTGRVDPKTALQIARVQNLQVK
ncbi:MAG: peptidoglycan-binding domain-containing protein [bacterium JZ-2024 1]